MSYFSIIRSWFEVARRCLTRSVLGGVGRGIVFVWALRWVGWSGRTSVWVAMYQDPRYTGGTIWQADSHATHPTIALKSAYTAALLIVPGQFH